MSRINIGKADEYIEEANPSTTWNIELGTYNLSNAVEGVEFEDSISQPGSFTLDLMVDPGEINGGERLKIDKEGVGAFNGIVTVPERSSQRDDTIKGGGAAELLKDIPISGEFLNTNTQDIVTNIFSQLGTTDVQVGVNEELSDGNGNVSVRAEDEGALNLLNRVVLSHGGDWYVSYNSSSDVFEFNVVNKLESSTVQKTFGDDAIGELRDAKVIDEEYDGVIVKGYGDGDDQITGEYPVRANWPNDPKILRYTDKTILSKEEADNTAESVYNDHTEWRNIYLYPANNNELLSLGDQVEINDSVTGINDTFRVVHRKFTVDYGGGEGIEYVLSDRPIGVIDTAEDVKEQTDSQTDYMQGSRNIWSDKEATNATSQQPLKLDFEVPQDIIDKAGNNNVSRIEFNYASEEFQQTAGESSVTADNFNPSVEFKDTTIANQGITMEKNDIKTHNHPIASSSTDAAADRQEFSGFNFINSIPSSGWTRLGGRTIGVGNVRNHLAHNIELDIQAIQDSSGSTISRDLHFAVLAKDDTPTASYVYNPSNPAAGDEVQFTNTSDGPVAGQHWTFDDPNSSTGQKSSILKNPTHNFLSGGTYNVTLEIWDTEDSFGDSVPVTRVLEADSSNNRFKVSSTNDQTYFETNDKIRIDQSNGNDGIYTITGTSLDTSNNIWVDVYESVDFSYTDTLKTGDMVYYHNPTSTVTQTLSVSSPNTISSGVESFSELDEAQKNSVKNAVTKPVNSEEINPQACNVEPAQGNPDESNVTQFVFQGSNQTVTHDGSVFDSENCSNDITVYVYGVKCEPSQFEGQTAVHYQQLFGTERVFPNDFDSFSIDETYQYNDFDSEFEGPSVNYWRIKLEDTADGTVYYDDFVRNTSGFPQPYFMVEPSDRTNILSLKDQNGNDATNGDGLKTSNIDVDVEYTSAGRFLGADLIIEDSGGAQVENTFLNDSSFQVQEELGPNESFTYSVNGNEVTIEFESSSGNTAYYRYNGVLDNVDEGQTFTLDGVTWLCRKVYDTSNYSGFMIVSYDDPTETYSLAEGTYTAKLVANHENRDTSIDIVDSVEFTISLNSPPSASFDYTPTNPDAFEPINFDDTSTDSDSTDAESNNDIVRWSWDFGDGTTETFLRNNGDDTGDTSHSYSSTGTYTVTLTVEDSEGEIDTASSTISVGGNDSLSKTVSMSGSDDVGGSPATLNSENIEGQATTFTNASTVAQSGVSNVGTQQSPAEDTYLQETFYIPYRNISSEYEIHVATQGGGSIDTLSGEVRVQLLNHTHDIPRRDDFEGTDPRKGAGAENKAIPYTKEGTDRGEILLDFSSNNETITLDTTQNSNSVTLTIDDGTNTEELFANNGTDTTTNTYQDSELSVTIESASDDTEFEIRDQSSVDSYTLAAGPAQRFSSASSTQKSEQVSTTGSQQKVLDGIDNDLLVGSKANNVRIYLDTDPDNESTNTREEITSDFYNTTTSEKPKDKGLDITQYIDNPGWYRLEIEPDGPTFLKSRVFLDHKKDSS